MFSQKDTIATSFMDNLAVSQRDAASEVFNFCDLTQMLEMRLKGPDEILSTRYNLHAEQWTEIFNAVILTKLSYFKIRFGFPNLYLNRLLEISGFCLGFPHTDAKTLASIIAREHPAFSDWLKHLEVVKRQNQLYASKSQK